MVKPAHNKPVTSKLFNRALGRTYNRKTQSKGQESSNSHDRCEINSPLPSPTLCPLDGNNFPPSNVCRSALLVIHKCHGLAQMPAWGLLLWKKLNKRTATIANNSKSPFNTYVHAYTYNPFITSQNALDDCLVTAELLWPCFKLDFLILWAYRPHPNSSQP